MAKKAYKYTVPFKKKPYLADLPGFTFQADQRGQDIGRIFDWLAFIGSLNPN